MERLIALAMVASLTACGTEPVFDADTNASELATSDRDDARPTRRRERRGFLRADANDDGAVTRAELGLEADGRFSRIDADGDGTASPTELASRRGRRERRGAEDADSRPVAAISRVEYRDRALARFDRRDEDKDGRLADDELGRRR